MLILILKRQRNMFKFVLIPNFKIKKKVIKNLENKITNSKTMKQTLPLFSFINTQKYFIYIYCF